MEFHAAFAAGLGETTSHKQYKIAAPSGATRYNAHMPDVAVYPATYENAAEAVRQAFEDFPLDLAGKRVLIKPNILTGADPSRAITTHPTIVAATLHETLTRGAAEVSIGDNPGIHGYGAVRKVARECGILDAAGEHFVNLGLNVESIRGASRWIDPMPYSALAREVDILISLPKAKTHACTTVTGAIKNSYGLLPGSVKLDLHRVASQGDNFSEAVVDVFAIRPPDMVILDAVWAMEGNGPSGGSPRELGVMLAGRNAVEIDAAMTTMFAMAPASIPMLRIAAERGLGRIDLESLDIAGELPVVHDFKPPMIARGVGNWAMRLLSSLWIAQPEPIASRCVRCGECARHCPVKCIRMTPLPVIDERQCVNCFCCHEFCKYDAMRLAPRLRIGGRKIRWT